jgi:hypothetical protein
MILKYKSGMMAEITNKPSWNIDKDVKKEVYVVGG